MIYHFILREGNPPDGGTPYRVRQCLKGTLHLDKQIRRAFPDGGRIQAETRSKQKELDGKWLVWGGGGREEEGTGEQLIIPRKGTQHKQKPSGRKGLDEKGKRFSFTEQKVVCGELVHQPDLCDASSSQLLSESLTSPHAVHSTPGQLYWAFLS